jgi:hypothetical protein
MVCAAGAAAMACGAVSGLTGRWRSSLAVQAAGMAAVGAAGAAVLFGAQRVGTRFRSGFSPALGVDRLRGFFLVVLAVIAVPAPYYARDALQGSCHRRVKRRVLPGAGRAGGGARCDELPRVLGADDSAARGRHPEHRVKRHLLALRDVSV